LIFRCSISRSNNSKTIRLEVSVAHRLVSCCWFCCGNKLMNILAALIITMPPPLPRTPTSSRRPATPTHDIGSSHQTASSQIVPQSPSTISRTLSASVGAPVVPVYQHVRNLNGIIRSIDRHLDIPADDDGSIPKLGPTTDSYLSTHGYTVGAISCIEHAVETHKSSQAFINYLHSRGMPWREAEYVWDLLQGDKA
jgi:hypothetical protein